MANFSSQLFFAICSSVVNDALIIHTLGRQSETVAKTRGQPQGQNEGHVQGRSIKFKQAEKQITITLLFVTFTFLILMMPYGSILIYVLVHDFPKSPRSLAGYHLFAGIANRAYFTNSGINFFLYVISGRKFRIDLAILFRCKRRSLMSTSSMDDHTSVISVSHIS